MADDWDLGGIKGANGKKHLYVCACVCVCVREKESAWRERVCIERGGYGKVWGIEA